MIALDTPRVWRRDTYGKVHHNLRLSDMTGVLKCEHCGLSEQAIISERLGCIASLRPKPLQPPKQKRRDGRFWKRR